jgi:hypothetical protein
MRMLLLCVTAGMLALSLAGCANLFNPININGTDFNPTTGTLLVEVSSVMPFDCYLSGKFQPSGFTTWRQLTITDPVRSDTGSHTFTYTISALDGYSGPRDSGIHYHFHISARERLDGHAPEPGDEWLYQATDFKEVDFVY